jgi:HD-GYP domain-containing protein (c-di-GMP phosphodiesterase class II)
MAATAVGKTPADQAPGERGFWLYLVLVAVGGPTVALALAVSRWSEIAAMTNREIVIAALLVLVAVSAGRFRFEIAHQVQVDVSTAASVAMLILLPLPLPGLLAPTAKALAVLVGRRDRRMDPIEFAFNVGQTAWCAVFGAITFAWVEAILSVDGGPAWWNQTVLFLATAAGFFALHLVNTGLVAGVAGLQLHYDPFRIWVASFRENFLTNGALATVAFAAAILIDHNPLALAALVLPLGLVHRAVRASAQLRRDTHSALAALVEVVELRDPYTAGHSRRVAKVARALAVRLGMSPEEADHLESAGRVHDIGKVAIDPKVLLKPGKLDPAEWAEMKRHPELGAEVIARFAAYPDGYRLVRHHHEAWDGSGYPDGLTGERIPLGARILAVADTFDALTSDRPYRPRMELERALAILTDGAGGQWDPRVVEALVEYLAVPRAVEAPPAAAPAPVASAAA